MDPIALFDANRELVTACLHTTFVQGLADGRLPSARFAGYVAQDAYFLGGFARAYAACLARSTDHAQLLSFKHLLDGVYEELHLHTGYAQRWGIDLTTMQPTDATLAYTDFLRAVSATEPLPHVIAAMVPCMRLYAWLARQLAPATRSDSPYREWVDTYANDGFHRLAAELEGLLTIPGGEPERMRWLYRRAMQLELGFFNAAGETPSTSDGSMNAQPA